MPLQATSGAASYDAFGGGVPVVPNYIEDVFSTYLYTGNGSTQTITNGIDLSTKGGMVWQKDRTSASTDGVVCDTARGVNAFLITNGIFASVNNGGTDAVYAYNTNGFSTSGTNGFNINLSGDATASWTFAKAPKFFDVLTYTGTGSNTTIAHSLGSVPACIIVKRTDTTGAWQVYHRSLANTEYLVLNTTAAKATGATRWNSTTPTSTVFSLGTDATVNASGGTYVAYLFAHDAGGFGLTGTDNVISCGSFTTDGSGAATINLGYEPQWLLVKRTDSTSQWFLWDTMRGFTANATSSVANLYANLSNAEAMGNGPAINSTGFTANGNLGSSASWVYIAIRRGPMKVPTSGTSVFDTQLGVSSTTATISSGFVTDAALALSRPDGAFGYGRNIYSRLQGNFQSMNTTKTDGEATAYNNTTISFDQNNGIKLNGGSVYSTGWVYEQFKRAPSFFDVVCYTGTGSARTVTHNLGVAPELMIVKRRDTAGYNWNVYLSTLGASSGLWLNDTTGELTGVVYWNSTSPTSSVFSIGSNVQVNASGGTYVAYLFATCAGVSKCTSFTGTGTLQTIDCGFTSGSRFILIKRTDSTGDWYVWDSSRGLSSSTDPYLLLNSTAAEVTSTNWVDTTSTGFQVTAASGNNVNINGATYIALAIA